MMITLVVIASVVLTLLLLNLPTIVMHALHVAWNVLRFPFDVSQGYEQALRVERERSPE